MHLPEILMAYAEDIVTTRGPRGVLTDVLYKTCMGDKIACVRKGVLCGRGVILLFAG